MKNIFSSANNAFGRLLLFTTACMVMAMSALLASRTVASNTAKHKAAYTITAKDIGTTGLNGVATISAIPTQNVTVSCLAVLLQKKDVVFTKAVTLQTVSNICQNSVTHAYQLTQDKTANFKSKTQPPSMACQNVHFKNQIRLEKIQV